MYSTLPLQRLFLQSVFDSDVITPWEKAVSASIDQAPFDEAVMGQLVEISEQHQPLFPWQHIKRWRETLALTLISCIQEVPGLWHERLVERALICSKYALWEEFQLASAFEVASRALLELPFKTYPRQQLTSGAVPLEWGGHWSWGEVPHGHFHAELGILWSVLGEKSGDLELLRAAERLAEWQLHTLDAHFFPFVGIFTQEADASITTLLTYNYLLFHSVGVFSARPDLKFVATTQLEHLKQCLKSAKQLPLLAPLLEAWIERKGRTIDEKATSLPPTICDRHTALTGYRTPEESVLATVFGGGTGLGAFHRHDVQVMSYGPQYLPLGECQGFGIEGSERFLQKHRRLEIITKDKEFFLRGDTCLVPRPKQALSPAHYRNGEPSGIWLDIAQRFCAGKLDIEISFMGICGIEALAFVFFVKAQSCYIGDHLKVKPHSFDRYQGKGQTSKFVGNQGELCIEANDKHSEMQVIPLSGGDSFWGADFLIAYLLDPKQARYSWRLG
jgi:hypothetical protein